MEGIHGQQERCLPLTETAPRESGDIASSCTWSGPRDFLFSNVQFILVSRLKVPLKSEHYQGANEGIVAGTVFTYEFDFASSDKGGVPAARPTSGFGMNSVRKWSVPSSHPRCKRVTSDRRSATLVPTKRRRGLTQNSRAGNPKRPRPNCHKKENSRNSVGSAQKGGGPRRRGAIGCCRLSRQLLARYGWTVACVGLFVSFVALLDKPVEDTSIVSRVPQQLRQRVGLHHLDLLRNCSSWESATPMTECHYRMLASQRNSAAWKRSITLRAVRAES